MELGKRKLQNSSVNDAADSTVLDRPSQAIPKIKSSTSIALNILVKVLFNPVVLMTTLGIVGNLVFHQQLPVILEGILKVFIF